MILTILFWTFAILIFSFALVEVIFRIVRRFIHFPIPTFVVRFIDNPVRRRIQSPVKVVDWMGIRGGMCVLEIGPGLGTFTIEASKRVSESGKIFAIDIQPSLILKLSSRLQRAKIANVMATVASAFELPFSNDTLD